MAIGSELDAMGATAGGEVIGIVVDGPTRVVPITPVPPVGVPWPLAGAVELEAPPAGATVETCAKPGSAANDTTMAAATTVAERRRIENFI